MMIDLIDRSEVLYKFAEVLPEADSINWYEQAKPDEVNDLVDEMYSIVLNVNRIDAQQVKHGKCCTGHANIHNAVYKYCTVCGSKMGGESDA